MPAGVYERSPEHRAAVSRALKGRKKPDSFRQGMAGNQRAKGRKDTTEQTLRKSQASREAWARGDFSKRAPNHGKSGYHNGTWMRCINSEGVFAQELDKAGISWKYEPRTFTLSTGTYTPDFYLPELDLWVDIKGWVRSEKQAKKMSDFKRETGKTLSVIFQRDLPRREYK